MVRLAIVSDSHQSQFWTQRFLDRANKERYDGVFHLGDGEAEARWLSRRLKMPFQYVAGNCDMFSKVAREIFASYEGHRILACHGHTHDVKWGLEQLSYYAEERGADIALYGHTHVPEHIPSYKGVTILNPGSLTYPRQAGGKCTYAVIEVDAGGELRIDMRTLD